MSFEWIEMETVLAVHDMQIAEHGGASGIRDIGLIESALAFEQLGKGAFSAASFTRWLKKNVTRI